ncbi:MAG: ABC transporter permease [Defluviitaleaceae bacterium]|nr:ABC transporter permease [Defluviitaleaceae bacterium]
MLRLIRISFSLSIREVRNIAFMLILPLLLTLILGIALATVFDSENDNAMAASVWFYYIEDSDSGDRLRDFLEEYHHRLNMVMTHEADRDTAIDGVSRRDADAYLIYADGVITIYQNEHASQSTRWLEIVFGNYMMRVGIIDEIVEYSANIDLLLFIRDMGMDLGSYVELLQIETIRQPDAIGYYAIAMITLTSVYSMVVLILSLSAERRRGTMKRYLLAGKTLFSFLFSKSVSITLTLLSKLTFIMLFNTFVYRVEFGGFGTWVTVLVVTVVFTFAVTQFASILCLVFKNLTALVVAVNVAFIPTVLFLGGAYLGYHMLIDMGMGDIIVFSPVYHLNRGFFDAIYLNSHDYIRQFTLIVAAAAAFIVAVNFILSKWRGNSWVQ